MLTPKRLCLVCALFFCLAFAGVAMAGDEWREVTPAELQMKTPKVEPDADAEAIFWEVRIDDSSDQGLSRSQYVRVKIFTERGRDKFSKFDIPFAKGIKIKDLAARVIKPDGTIVEIGKDDIFEREIIKTSGVKVKAKSFAVPNIEPGVIVEYRYKEVFAAGGAKGMHLQFQQDIPIQNLSYFYKPYNSREPVYQSYNFTDIKFVKDKGGFYVAARTNIPALKEEPRMPPEDAVKPWMLLTGARVSIIDASEFSFSFTIKDPTDPGRYWAAFGTDHAGLAKIMIKGSSDIKTAAAEITSGSATADDKLRKLYAFCQSQIHNTTFDPTLTDEARQKLPAIKSLSDVLKRRSASAQFVDMLFGSFAASLGLDTRIVYTADRSEIFFEPNMTNEALVHPAAIAVKVDNEWHFFNPGVPFLPYGSLVWYEENNWAILVGETNFQWVRTPLSGYEVSVAKRTGKFNLLEDGTLEGEVRVEEMGHPAEAYRLDNYDESLASLGEKLKNEVKGRINGAEVTNATVENLSDPSKPLVTTYKIRAAGYAQKTGKRLFLQPGFFEYGTNPLFSSSTRKYDLFFKYPWSELDNIEISYPKNYDLDSADAPGTVADPQKIGLLDVQIAVDKATNTLVYKRDFHFGGGGNVLFKAASYQPIKNLFDHFYQSDSHTITLKQQ